MKILKKVNNKTLVEGYRDNYLKQSDVYLIKEFKNSFRIDSFHTWEINNQRTSRKRGKQEYIGKEFIKQLNTLITT